MFGNSAILTPLNKDVDSINEEAIKQMHGDVHTSLSVDYILEEEAARSIDEEWLWKQNVSALPLHELLLKLHVTDIYKTFL